MARHIGIRRKKTHGSQPGILNYIMTRRPLSQCNHAGCTALVQGHGYCPVHQRQSEQDRRQAFDKLEDMVSPEQRRFYQSQAWTQASRLHRSREPLCRRCKAIGKIIAAQCVHHNPCYTTLHAQGLSALDDRYLESLCNRCHLAELRTKRRG